MNEREKRAHVERIVKSWPGQRGVHIPTDLYDRIYQSANGITQSLWGRPPTPEQMQFLHDNGHHTPHAVRAAYGELPHPHAPGLTVGSYEKWAKAHKAYKQGGGR